MEGHEVEPLTTHQRRVLRLVARLYEREGKIPSGRRIARLLAVSHTAIQDTLREAYRRGWLKTPTTDGLRCPHVP